MISLVFTLSLAFAFCLFGWEFTSMGRVKLKIKKLENTNGRQATFAKRRVGLFKKANELAILCDIDILLVMFSPTGKPALYCGRRSNIEEVIAKLSQVKPQERNKKKFESLDVLRKTFRKLDHDVKICQFIRSRNPSAEELSSQTRILQTRISEIQGRLSNWTEPDKLNDVDHLRQLEISIRQSLEQLRLHKEHLEQQQQQAVQIENENFFKDWSTCSIKDEIQIPLEQQLQSLPWVLINNSTNTVPNREVECSGSSSFGSYPSYFGTGKSQELAISGQEAVFLDELNTRELKPETNSDQPFTNIAAYNPILQNDLNQQQTLPPPPPPPDQHHYPSIYNFPMNQKEYHVNGFFEAPVPECSAYNNTNQTWFGPSSSLFPSSVSMFDEYLFSQMQQPN